MENIGKYLKFCEEQLGVPKGDQFQTVDLYEKQNMANVSIKNNILKTKLQLKNVINNLLLTVCIWSLLQITVVTIFDYM